MDINGKIQTYLKQRKKLKRSLPFHAMLSLLVTICVVSNLIMPAISMSIENTLNSIVETQKATAEPGVPSTIDGMLDLTSADEWLATISGDGGNTYFYDATHEQVNVNQSFSTAQDPLNLSVYIEYNFDQDVKSFLTAAGAGPHLAWDLGNESLTAIFPGGVNYGEINDPTYTAGIAGTYVIEKGIIKITLTDDYLAYVTGGTGKLVGSLDFSGTLSRSETDDGDQSFTMAGQTVIVDFPDKYAKITNKSANVQDDGTVKWTVTINNDKGADLKDYVLTDTMLNGASNLTLSPALGYTQDGNSLKITDSSTSQWLTITYTTPIDKAQIEAGSQKNTATLQKGTDDKSISTGESTAWFTKTPLTVNKSGKQDYNDGDGEYGGKINWTVSVTNNYGLSLDGYIVKDPMIPTDLVGVSVSPNGTLTYSGSDNKFVLDTTASSVTITYSTTAEIGNNSNTATAYYPTGDAPSKGGNSESESVEYVDEKGLFTLLKSSTVNTSNGTINWKITISNNYYEDLTGYTITDLMLGSATSITYTPSGVGTQNGNTITLTDVSKTTNYIEINYVTPITNDQLQDKTDSRKNVVTFNDDEGNELWEKDNTASFNQNTNFTVVKSAKADYESGAHNGKITWTLKITSNYGTSLDGYLIDDAKLTEGATVSPSGTLTQNGDKWELSGTNGAKTVTITYQTTAELESDSKGKDNSNNATLYYPDGTGTGDGGSDSETIYYKSVAELVSIQKYGNYDQDKHQITWTVNVYVQGGLSLDGYQLTDDQFPAELSGISFSPAEAGTNATLADGVLTLGNPNYKGSVTLTYTKPVDVSSVTENYTATNDVGIGHDSFSATTTGTANVTVRNTLNKYSNNGNVYYITNNGIVTKTVSWTADLVLDNSFSGKVYEDTLTIQSGDGTHTITDTQLAAIKVYGRVQQYGGDTLLVLDTDYTVERTTNGFKITFKDTLDAAGYNFVRISYDTTMTANAPTSTEGYPYTYVYDNTASFNGNTDNDNDYTITRNNPESYESLDLTLNKTWNPGPQQPASVTAKILYKTNQDDTWRYLHIADGKAVYYEDSTYGSASDYIVTLNEAGEWKQTVTGLHRAITKADANGNSLPTVNYFYKIEEITPEGTVVESGLYETDGGYYQVNYENNNGINYSGTIRIKNEFKANTSVTPEKLWDGDTGTGNGFDSVTVQLEFSTDWGGTRYPVKIDANGEYIFDTTDTAAGTIVTQEITKDDNWIGTTWADLPSIIVVNGSAVACQYTIREIAVTQTAATEGAEGTEIVINGDKFITADGYYTVSNSGSGTGTLTVKNTFTKTVNYAINVVKGWEGDVNNSDSRPEVILVQLQQSANWGNWKNYGEPVAISADGSWSTAFTGLPNQFVAEDGTVTTYRYRVIEAGYKKTADSAAVMLPENANSFATDENGVYNISYTNSVNPYSGNSEMSQAGTVTIKNTFTPVTTIDLTPQKKWTGDTNVVSTDRPKSITFTLQYREGWGGTWKNVEENNQAVTVTLTDDANTTTESEWVWNNSTYQNEEVVITFWNGTTLTGLPSEKITINSDGSYTKSTLYYRFVETAYVSADNISTNIDPSIYATSSTKDDNFKTGNGKYDITYNDTYMTGTLTVTNNFTAAVGIEKFAVDKNGNELDSTMEIEDLADHKYTIDGEDYYVFNWMIKYDLTNFGNGDKLPTLRDQLPQGFELLYDNSFVGETKDWAGKYSGQWWGDNGGSFAKVMANYYNNCGYILHPFIIYPNNGWGAGAQPAESAEAIFEKYMHVVNFDNPDFWYYYDESTNEVYFNKYKATAPAMVYYAIKIKCSELDAKIAKGSYTISNTAYTYDDSSATEEGRVPILDTTGSIKIFNPVDTNLITKSYSETKIPGNIQYSLNINPEGKNLSSGDTIDIQDLFETVSYFDHDYAGGQLTSGKKLVDVLMNNIKLYKVDANGNKIELTSSEYTLMFQSGTEVADGAALMKLTIPDETHIVVDYTYKLIANETTPSVIHGCKSSTRVNGRYVTMAPGLVPPAGDKITFSNTASLISDSAESSDSETNTEYEVFKSSGTITTNALPSIKKVNTGDYSINNLSATFLLARYENGRWYFVDSATLANADKNEYDITWGTIGSDGTRISSDATTIDIVNGTDFKIPLDENTLYKLIEIVVPNGYEGSNLGLTDEQFEEMIRAYLNDGATHYNDKDYTVFLNHYISTHYFTYNSTVSSYPSGVAAGDVIQVKSGSDVEIPNNKLIDLGVEKEWINPTTDTTDSQITVELYWSYTKDTNGIPSDAVLAKAEDLGILDENFTAVKTITVGDAANKKLWEDLPNGTDRKPIYYYIKETAYTIGGKTYSLDTESNTYKAETGEPGAYFPTYSGNAANDDAIIGVKNSHQLMLKKEWKNASNIPMKNIPVNGVVVSIYGIDMDGAQTTAPLFEGVELSVANNWTADLTSLLGTTDLSLYKAFVAVENENPDLAGYVVSCVFNLNAQTGEIIVTNKNTAATDASVTVNKIWSDGADLHANESITATLYQSQTEITDLTGLSAKLPLVGATVMQPVDENDTQSYEVTLNAENNWTYSWTGLPLEDEDQNKYYYYVLETMSDVANADKYTVTYVVTDKTPTKTEYTVKNYRNAIVVEKEWLAEDGTALTKDELEELGIESITLDVLKEVATVPEDGLHVVTFGDSITDSYNKGTPYPYQMTDILEDDYGYTLIGLENNYIKKMGYSGYQIGSNSTSGLRGQVSGVPTDADVVCVLGGTNDIHQGGKWGSNTAFINPEECLNRLKAWISEIDTRVTNEDLVIIVGSIPHFDFIDASGNTTDGYGYWGNFVSDYGYESIQAAEDAANKYIDQYNALIKTYAESTSGLYFADVCAAVNKDTMLADGCHPNTTGYGEVAKTFATAINNAFSQSAEVGQITLTADNNWIGSFDIEDTDASIEYYVDESDLPAGWTVTYTNNAQKAGSSTPITVTNKKYTPTTSLQVEKIWKNDEANTSGRANISLALLRSIDGTNWEEVDVTFPAYTEGDDGAGNDMWTYSFTGLAAEDALGRQYFYKVEEDFLPGYTASYYNSSIEAVDGGNAGSLRLSNTRAISLNLEKIWSDIDENDHVGDPVTIRIYRTTDPSTLDTSNVNLILQVPTVASVGVGKTTDVYANKTPATVTSSDENIARATFDGNKITIEGIANGTAKIAVSDGTDTIEITVTVSALEMFLNGETDFTMTAGTQGTLSAELGGVAASNAEFSSTSALVTINGNQITANNIGEDIPITATVTMDDGTKMNLTVSLDIVLPSTFSITGGTTVAMGGELQLGVDPAYGTFTWSAPESTVASVEAATGKVTGGTTTGTIVITATRNDGVTATHEVTVNNPAISFDLNSNGTKELVAEIDSDEYVSVIKLEFDKDNPPSTWYNNLSVKIQYYDTWTNIWSPYWQNVCDLTIESGKDSGVFTCNNSSGNVTVTIADNVITITVKNPTEFDYSEGGKVSITANGGNWSGNYVLTTVDSTASASVASVNTNLSTAFRKSTSDSGIATIADTANDWSQGYIEVVLQNTSDGGLTTTIANLDAYDSETGKLYYYYVEEVHDYTNYDISYSYDDGDGNSSFWINAEMPNEEGEFNVTVRNTKVESPGVELPSTGGSGTAKHYGIGLILISGSAAAYIMLKRRERKTS